MNTKVAVGIEADDMVVYLKDTNYDKYILCDIDKDLLYKTECTHYDYGKETTVTITADEAIHFSYYQTLAGDVTDDYKGCPGIGKVKATKLLESIKDPIELWNITLETFLSKGLTEEDAINTMRLANMKQYNGKEVILWLPPGH
jgi:DNA polymerase-1